MKIISLTMLLAVILILLCACTRFDEQVWKTDKDKRNTMYSQLTLKYDQIGMSEQEIIELLGEPESKPNEYRYEYFLGYAGFMGIKVNVLELNFNSEGIVVSYEVEAH